VIDPTLWCPEPGVVIPWSNGAIEDVVVERDGISFYRAFFTAGDSLQNQRLWNAIGRSPLGPFTDARRYLNTEQHTRMSRGQMPCGSNDWVIMDVWPGLPKCGLFLAKSCADFSIRTPLVKPTAGTGYEVAAGNPCVIRDDKGYTIFFEGRGSVIRWNLFQAWWSGDPNELAVVNKTPICEGANPYCVLFDNTYYLYYSKYNDTKNGFESRVMTQDT
jgi:hypothetical protein